MTSDPPTGLPVEPSAAPTAGAGARRRDRTLRLAPAAPEDGAPDTTTLVLDTTWTAARDPEGDGVAGSPMGLREVAERVLADRDLFAEAYERLDDWASRSAIADDLTFDGVSYWPGARLGYWMWLVDALLWLAVIDDRLRADPRLGRIVCGAGTDPALVAIARLAAARDGIACEVEDAPGEGPAAAGEPDEAAAGSPVPTATPAPPGRRRRSLPARVRWRLWPPPPERRRRSIGRRLRRLSRERPARLLVVQAHARQRIDLPDGPRLMNPYLGPIVDRLRKTRLDPIEVDIRSRIEDDGVWARLHDRAERRTLPADVLTMNGPTILAVDAHAQADDIADRIGRGRTSLVIDGVDLGPALTERVATRSRRTAFLAIYDVPKIRALLRRLRPAGILLADEYHRHDWLAAAAAEGIPTAAVQHGVIYRWHSGYIHTSRPASLRLPDRTYVFGPWEQRLLTTASVYRPEEVVVGGSPRIDLAEALPTDRDAVRHELGVAATDRMVVLSGTWGELYRRFLYPIALRSLFRSPAERLHLVVKLHPSEKDEGPYRAIIENLAAAGGFAPPRITTVQRIDLYRLLAAADAHLGIHSTLLTEAVVTGTPNLLATGLRASDILGYVEAGVAIPVETPADLAAALDRPRAEAMRPEARDAFLREHFEAGVASRRIADDLLAWLP